MAKWLDDCEVNGPPTTRVGEYGQCVVMGPDRFVIFFERYDYTPAGDSGHMVVTRIG